jgi:xylitol oxidase
MKGDNIPMSPAKGNGTTVGFHFTWVRNHDELIRVLPTIEKALKPFGVKPHFGKLFVLDGNYFQKVYKDDIEGLKSLIQKQDP